MDFTNFAEGEWEHMEFHGEQEFNTSEMNML